MKFKPPFERNRRIRVPNGSGADGLYSQDLFRDLLVYERKRSERSKQPFFFVALDIQDVLTETITDTEVVRDIIKSIIKASREVDIIGWYETTVCIGIIYTEISANAYEQVLNKIRQELSDSLNGERASLIRITYTSFPEKDGKQWTHDRSGEKVLYPPIPMLTERNKTQLWLKRFLDLTGSGVGIVLLSPLLMFITLLIKVTSPGPTIFKQERVGLGGQKFMLYKFRSMQINNNPAIHQDFVKNLIAGQAQVSEKGKAPSYKIQNDPRVTTIGRFIRATSIDELPQLFNVLFGNMSLVGPRPPLSYEVEMYKAWHRPRVVEVKPGITGLWQVKGRSKTTFDGMVRMDLEYIHNWSLWLDVKLLLKTPVAVVTAKGAF